MKSDICTYARRRLRALRYERNMSQRELCRLTGYHPNSLYTTEKGTRNIYLHDIEVFCKALGVTFKEFFEEYQE